MSENGANGGAPKLTVYDLHGPAERRDGLRRLPQLTAGGLRLVWRASRKHFLFTMVLNLAAGLAVGGQLLVARELLNGLLDVAANGASATTLLPEFGALILATAGLGIVTALLSHEQRLLNELVTQHAFEQIIGVATTVDLASFEDPTFHDQLQRAKTSGTYRSIQLVSNINALLTGLVVSIGIAAVLILLEPLLVLFVSLAAVPVLIATIHNSRTAYAFEYAMTPESRERAYLVDLLTEEDSAKEVRVFDAAPLLRTRYQALTAERLRRLREFLRKRLGVEVIGTVASAVGTAVALGSLVWLIAKARIDIASALTAGFAMQQLASRLQAVMTGLGNVIESGMFVDDYKTFLEFAPNLEETRPEEIEEDLSLVHREGSLRSLDVENLSFTYPGTATPVLTDVSLSVGAGEVIALVGENGSGKTTLVKLICGLYALTTGRISWNGVDADDLYPEEIRDDMTVLFQDFIQYHLSAHDNIALGRVQKGSKRADVIRAAEQAGAHDFLSRLPQDYQARLGRQFYGGHELSVGQWQRVALARAFFRGGSFLVLDEPTAALDPRAESELFSQMRELAAGRSVLLISHRFSSVRSADRIYVLDRGRVIESGSHDELMALDGQYAGLFNLQAAAYLGTAASERP